MHRLLSFSITSLLLPFIALLLVAGQACQEDGSDHHPDSAVTKRPAPVDTAGRRRTEQPTPVTGSPSGAKWSNTEVVRTVHEFVAAIDAGDSARFRRMLSSRSESHITEFGAQREIWSVANEALGRIDKLNVRVLGGTRDSVALLMNGQRIIKDDTIPTPLIISLLRENNTWKVMYPGLQYPEGHLRK